MITPLHAEFTASISDFKKAPMQTIKEADGEVVAVLNRNKPAFYCIPAYKYAELIERLEDLELNAIADKRKNKKRIKVSLDDL